MKLSKKGKKTLLRGISERNYTTLGIVQNRLLTVNTLMAGGEIFDMRGGVAPVNKIPVANKILRICDCGGIVAALTPKPDIIVFNPVTLESKKWKNIEVTEALYSKPAMFWFGNRLYIHECESVIYYVYEINQDLSPRFIGKLEIDFRLGELTTDGEFIYAELVEVGGQSITDVAKLRVKSDGDFEIIKSFNWEGENIEYITPYRDLILISYEWSIDSFFKEDLSLGYISIKDSGLMAPLVWNNCLVTQSKGNKIKQWTMPNRWTIVNHAMFDFMTRHEIREMWFIARTSKESQLARLPREILFEVTRAIADIAMNSDEYLTEVIDNE